MRRRSIAISWGDAKTFARYFTMGSTAGWELPAAASGECQPRPEDLRDAALDGVCGALSRRRQ